MSEKLSVLLVEDDIHDVEAVQRAFRVLQPSVFELVHVPRFLDAIQRLQKESFHVVILDLGLPDSVGLNGVQRLMKMIPTVPVIVLTGVDDEATALKAIELGAQEFLDKNRVSPRDLVRTIRNATKRKQHWIQSLEEHKNRASGANLAADKEDVAMDSLSATLEETSNLVLSKTESLMKTELSEQQRLMVSGISELTRKNFDSIKAFRQKSDASGSSAVGSINSGNGGKNGGDGGSGIFKPVPKGG